MPHLFRQSLWGLFLTLAPWPFSWNPKLYDEQLVLLPFHVSKLVQYCYAQGFQCVSLHDLFGPPIGTRELSRDINMSFTQISHPH